MSKRMPVVFVSHGSPDALLKAPDAVACWGEIAQRAPKPASILIVSAHWQERQPTTNLPSTPDTIHDFMGFSPELYRMQYRAPGSPTLANKAVALLGVAGVKADTDPTRGLDHGAWIPLTGMYPQADVPVAQLSLVLDNGPAAHFELGRALAPLREEGVLIVASGAITHNFSWLDWRAKPDQAPHPKAQAFNEWVAEKLAAKDVQSLLNYRSAPYGAESHPTDEHFLPMFFALGAARDDTPVRYQPGFAYGSLSMDAYVWQE